MSSRQRKIIGVIGAGQCDDEIYNLATEVGRLIALKGAILVCGGLHGVMEAAAKGAFKAGGLTVGILPGASRHDANQFIMIPIATGLDHVRNVLIVRSSDGLIAIGGSYGTLSEIALAKKMNKPLILLNSWKLHDHLPIATSPEESVEWVFNQCQ